jgi:hypothetical protein
VQGGWGDTSQFVLGSMETGRTATAIWKNSKQLNADALLAPCLRCVLCAVAGPHCWAHPR